MAFVTGFIEQTFTHQGQSVVVSKCVGCGSHKSVFAAELYTTCGCVPQQVAAIYARSQPQWGSPLRREVEALRSCKGVPGIVQTIGSPVAVGGGWVRIVTDLCEEGDFVQWSQGKSQRERFTVLLDVAKTLKVLHEKTLGHRDIKPANIGVKKDETGCFHGILMDCELLISEGKWAAEEQGLLKGSPAYCPPYGDQRDAQNVEYSTPSQHDVYALGATLFEACQSEVVQGSLCLNITSAFDRSRNPYIYLPNTTMSEIQAVIERTKILEPIRELLLSMLHTNPKERCSIDYVVEKMEEILRLPLPELDELPAVTRDGTMGFSLSLSSLHDSLNPEEVAKQSGTVVAGTKR